MTGVALIVFVPGSYHLLQPPSPPELPTLAMKTLGK
jgi:hypothetical protein